MGYRGGKLAVYLVTLTCILVVIRSSNSNPPQTQMSPDEKRQLRDKAVEMFDHAYNSYMDHAYPADELMPLSCKGRFRGTEPSRGDIDDTMGNFTLTLIDSLDTLAILGKLAEFDRAVRLVIQDAKFDADVIVSVFETNIRVLGGLLGGHVAAVFFKQRGLGMEWYNNELLAQAKEVGDRLLPAFNTSTGIPYPRINLKHGITPKMASSTRDTCTSCAGTMILEFAALSRLTGIAVYEEKAHKAMNYLWSQRHRTSDLMGTVINLHNGDWIRRESGVGAGIDSYYEYVLKAYVLLGDDTYLARFNKHYDAVKRYIRQGPLLVDVHMHKPTSTSRNFMDALLAFWPGLQVMFGDIGSAVETHEMLYQVVQRHNFLPEAFTTDFRVHWAQHPLRPEFLESTYFLYEATSDPYYLEVGKRVLNNLETHARVDCGFAAIKDLKKGTLEDQMDSFVLAETFKYLYLLFSDKEDNVLDVDSFVFTTEAHILPLKLSVGNYSWRAPVKTTPDLDKLDMMSVAEMTKAIEEDMLPHSIHSSSPSSSQQSGYNDDSVTAAQGVCFNYQLSVPDSYTYVHGIRQQLRNLVDGVPPKIRTNRPRLKASEFVAGNKEHMEMLTNMGIRIATMQDGRIQLLHTASDALSQAYAEDGLVFMQEMIELSKSQKQESQHEPVYVRLLAPPPLNGDKAFRAGPAQFGYDLNGNKPVSGRVVHANPYKACGPLENGFDIVGNVAVMERGDCMFVEKARFIQNNGGIGGIVIDSSQGTSSDQLSLFAMSGDGTQDVTIPMVFLFHKQGMELLQYLEQYPDLEVELTCQEMEDEDDIEDINSEKSDLASGPTKCSPSASAPPQSSSSSAKSSPSQDFSQSSAPPPPQPSSSSWSSHTPSPPNQQQQQHDLPPPTKSGHAFYRNDFLDPTQRIYILQGGTKFFHLSVEVSLIESSHREEEKAGYVNTKSDQSNNQIKSSDSSNRRVMTYEPLPDNSKLFSFYLKHPMRKSGHIEKPNLNEMYLDVIHSLQHETNLEKLARRSEYMKAIARLLESAYFQLDHIDKTALDSLFEFVHEVQVKIFYPDNKQAVVGENVNSNKKFFDKGDSSPDDLNVLFSSPTGDKNANYKFVDEVHVKDTGMRSGIKISVRSAPDGSYKAYVDTETEVKSNDVAFVAKIDLSQQQSKGGGVTTEEMLASPRTTDFSVDNGSSNRDNGGSVDDGVREKEPIGVDIDRNFIPQSDRVQRGQESERTDNKVSGSEDSSIRVVNSEVSLDSVPDVGNNLPLPSSSSSSSSSSSLSSLPMTMEKEPSHTKDEL